MVIEPHDEADVLAALDDASRKGGTLRVVGGETQTPVVLCSLDDQLRTSYVSVVKDYDPANLSLTVGAGCPYATMRQLLAEKNQILPVDPWRPQAATAGGIAASGWSGLRRTRYGALRDQVIGLRVATTLGDVVPVGGKVMKNVAGLDLVRLFVGSFGTLGVITEVTYRVTPMPEVTGLVTYSYSSYKEAVRSARALQDYPPYWSAIIISNTNKPETVDVQILIEGFEEEVSRGRQECLAHAQRFPGIAEPVWVHFDRTDADPLESLWEALLAEKYDTVWRLSAVPAKVPSLVQSVVSQLAPYSIDHGLLHSFSTGVVYLGFSHRTETTRSPLIPDAMKGFVAATGGSAYLLRGKTRPQDRGDGVAPVFARLKQRLDPNGVLPTWFGNVL